MILKRYRYPHCVTNRSTRRSIRYRRMHKNNLQYHTCSHVKQASTNDRRKSRFRTDTPLASSHFRFFLNVVEKLLRTWFVFRIIAFTEPEYLAISTSGHLVSTRRTRVHPVATLARGHLKVFKAYVYVTDSEIKLPQSSDQLTHLSGELDGMKRVKNESPSLRQYNISRLLN